jgi:hypothetical protein
MSEPATCPTCSGKLGGLYKNRCYTCKPCVKKTSGETILCATCDEPFYVRKNRLARAKYCSPKCSGEGRRKGTAPPGHKQCLKCREVKALDAFAAASAKWDGKHIWCRACTSNTRIHTPERERHRHGNHLKRKYGITLAEYELMVERQRGLCAICGGPPVKGRGAARERFNVDHCHKTGRIRGLLCSGCNRGLGYLGDTAVGLQAAVDYLSKWELA